MSKKPVPTEKEVREFFQRSYYVVPITGDDGDTVYQMDWVGPAIPVEVDDDSDEGL